ncbi:MAG TPA: polysaccharide biosynthesis C-terminal domain-containing protein [Terriglobia bacterium]|nr:polysaccharide biosynthesis C-terminal domain-containing protein [Terriglobia bacterium]
MDYKSLTAKNTLANWTALVINTVVGFFLAPFILHKLGDSANGLYYLIGTVVGYYGLLDLGIGTSIIQYVARFNATGDDESLYRIVNTTLFAYTILGLIVLALTGAGYFYVDSFFHISPQFLRTARLLFLITGAGVAFYFPFSIFFGIIDGLQKFYLTALLAAFFTVLRAVLVVIFLDRGYGLLTLALISVGAFSVCNNVACMAITPKLIRLRWGWRYVDRKTIHLIFNYSFTSFIISIANTLRGRADNVVIGVFRSTEAITYYSIGQRLVEYVNRITGSIAGNFNALASHLHSSGDEKGLQKLYIEGNRLCTLAFLPVSAGLFILGRPLIAIWMGPQYVSASFAILVILLIPNILCGIQSASTRILYGMNLHKWLAKVMIGEGVANLVLSVILVRRMGIFGVAWGTAIPMAFTSVVLIPFYLCRVVKVPLFQFVRRTYTIPVILTSPMVAVLLVLKHFITAQTWFALAAQVIAGGLVYIALFSWWFFTRDSMGIRMRSRYAQYVPRFFSSKGSDVSSRG